MKMTIPYIVAGIALCAGMALGQTRAFVVEADPDFYFDRGVTMAAGFKPSPESRWTFLGNFASRKIGPASARDRLNWRVGAGVRYRFHGRRNGLFGELDLTADRRTSPASRGTGASLRPAAGYEWHPWSDWGFYVLPMVSVEHYPGSRTASARGELRVGWQF